jgi:glutaryl-CoA dehydrogenase
MSTNGILNGTAKKSAKFVNNPFDYYNVDSLFAPEERLVRDTVRSFVDAEVLPIIEKHYEAGTAPTELGAKMAELGIFGITLPEEYGCAGASYTAYGLAMQELERGDSALRSFASVQSSLVMYPIYEYGSEAQRLQWLPRLASAEAPMA